MIGNDIVDLDMLFEQHKASNNRFLSKICTENEINYIKKSELPDLSLWRIWTMKESAYKIASALNNFRLYNPKKFETKIYDTENGIVDSQWGCFNVYTIVNNDFIHSIAYTGDFFFDEKIALTQNYSSEVRELCLQHLKLKVPNIINPFIDSENGVPMIMTESTKNNISISLSHQGRYLAWAFEPG